MISTLKQLGEFGLIDRISKGCLIRPDRVIRGIGDDAAAVMFPDETILLLTTDFLVEGIHFLRSSISGFDLGHKSLAVNLSDIAAMGGLAREALVSIAVPPDCDIEFIDNCYRGMKALAAEHTVNIIGGDTTAARSDLVISVTVCGSVKKEKILCRNGARPGDTICLTGYPGESAAGLHLVLNDIDTQTDVFTYLRRRHYSPLPHLAEGHWLAGTGAVTAAIDISDGLSSDLGHVIRQSGVGARIHMDRLPVSDALSQFCRRLGPDALDYVLHGGEDYILLCTLSSADFVDIARKFEQRFQRPLYSIGEIITGDHIELVKAPGKIQRISSKGWNHFK